MNLSPLLPLLLLPALAACRSTPPPPAAPPAVALADATAAQAARLLDAGNWPAAARQWDLAAQRFQLVNDLAGAATARHNAGIAWQAAGDPAAAHERLAQAAALNEELGRRDDWWRNQVALLALELDAAEACGAANRLARLAPRAGEITEPRVKLLYHQARARALLAEGRADAAAEALAAALALAPEGGPDRASLEATRARLAEARGELTEAEVAWRASLRAGEAAGDPAGVAAALAGLGAVLRLQPGREEEGRRLLERAAENYRVLRVPAAEAGVRARLAGPEQP